MDKMVKWSPFRDVLNVRDDFDRLVDKWFRPEFDFLAEGRAPKIDMYEEGGNLLVRAEVPGYDKKDISLSLSEDALTITGKHAEEKEEKQENYYRKEIRRGSFSRSVELPRKVDKDKADATYKDGILIVSLPISKESKQKETRINVK